MTKEELLKKIDFEKSWLYDCGIFGSDVDIAFHAIKNSVIEALEQEPCGKDINVPTTDAISRIDTRIIHTDGLEEGIRCAMCTNPMANDRGCDGGCAVNESMYKRVLDVIKKNILEQHPCEDAISRQAVCNIVDAIRDCISVEGYWAILERLKKLPSVKPTQNISIQITEREKYGRFN